jgi:hypothetical protein
MEMEMAAGTTVAAAAAADPGLNVALEEIAA